MGGPPGVTVASGGLVESLPGPIEVEGAVGVGAVVVGAVTVGAVVVGGDVVGPVVTVVVGAAVLVVDGVVVVVVGTASTCIEVEPQVQPLPGTFRHALTVCWPASVSTGI